MAGRIARKARTALMRASCDPPFPLDCGRLPRFGPSLPVEMGAGGWPVGEPTNQELVFFLELLDKVPCTYFGSHPPDSPDYGTRYSAVIVVVQWLKLISRARLLDEEREGK